MTYVRIVAPHFVAALGVERGIVMDCAPILRWAYGRNWRWLKDYLRRKGWEWERLNVGGEP